VQSNSCRHIGNSSKTLIPIGKRSKQMIEAPTTENTRRAMERAHEERAQAMRDAWNWLFHSNSSR
jgi:hypothetical protein